MPRRKKETPQTAVVEAIAKPHPRTKLYGEIIDVVTTGFREYYEKHPERENDERAKEAANCSFFGMESILEILERYDIWYKSDD